VVRSRRIGANAGQSLWQPSPVRRLIPWVLLAILGTVTVTAGFSGRSSAPSREHRSLVSPYYLTGLPLSLARQVAGDAGIHLWVIRVPSKAPVGQVIGEDPNIEKDQTVVVSTGRLRDPFKVLAPATVPPRHAECAGGLVLYEDGNVGPLTCGGGVNAGAWDSLAPIAASPLVVLGRNPTQAQVITAICAGSSETTNQLDSVYQLASAYYGWNFGEQLLLDYAYGLQGHSCPSDA
jgi:hypothetical protein